MTTFTGTIPTIASGDTTTVPTNLATYRDALKAANEAWTAYGSASSFTGATTNPVLNNGTWVGHYKQVNKSIEFWVRITIGSITTFGSGNYRIALPVAPFAASPAHADILVTDASSGAIYRGLVYTVSGTVASLAVDNGTAGGPMQQMTSAVPMTFAVSDTIDVWGSYEAA